MANSNIAGYDIEKDPFAPSLLHEITPEGEADITASASVDSTTGTPAVVVTRTKPDETTYNFNFAFSGIKGEQGLQGEQGIQGDRGLRGLQGEQGVQGNPGAQGPQGIQGVGIAGISYIGDDASGNAVYRITLTNNATYDFTAYRGPQGEKGDQGLPGTGEDGVGISDISYTSTDENGNNIYTVTLSNSQTYTFTANRGPQGLPGNDGADGVTPIISATASVDSTSGTPSVTVTKTGTDDAPAFDFAFTGLKGADGGLTLKHSFSAYPSFRTGITTSSLGWGTVCNLRFGFFSGSTGTSDYNFITDRLIEVGEDIIIKPADTRYFIASLVHSCNTGSAYHNFTLNLNNIELALVDSSNNVYGYATLLCECTSSMGSATDSNIVNIYVPNQIIKFNVTKDIPSGTSLMFRPYNSGSVLAYFVTNFSDVSSITLSNTSNVDSNLLTTINIYY